jgi:hypothetical protein
VGTLDGLDGRIPLGADGTDAERPGSFDQAPVLSDGGAQGSSGSVVVLIDQAALAPMQKDGPDPSMGTRADCQ